MLMVSSETVSFDVYTLDLMRCALLRGGETIGLRPKAFDVLRYLVEHAGRLVSKEELVGAVWRGISVTDDSVVQCVKDIREALSDDNHRIIQTVPRRGYLFAARVGPSSIAVLPFADLSGDSENSEYLGDGLAEELINTLTQIPGLKVTSRSSSFRFRGKAQDIRSIGKALNVTTILEGSVRRAGDQLRITAQLVSVDDGYHLWSETYDRRLGDVLAIQEDIARAIADRLQVRPRGDIPKPKARRHTDNTEAYHLYLTRCQQTLRREHLVFSRQHYACPLTKIGRTEPDNLVSCDMSERIPGSYKCNRCLRRILDPSYSKSFLAHGCRLQRNAAPLAVLGREWYALIGSRALLRLRCVRARGHLPVASWAASRRAPDRILLPLGEVARRPAGNKADVMDSPG